MLVSAVAVALILGERLGGFTHFYQLQAKQWLSQGVSLVLIGDQWSAAAEQVVLYRRSGGKICARKGVSLHFHAHCNARTGKCSGNPNIWVTRKPSYYGISSCNPLHKGKNTR